MLAAEHFVLHRGVGDRRAEVVLRANRGGDLFAELDRLLRRFDRDFVLRLLVLFDAERAAAVVHDLQVVLPERGVGGEFEFAGDAAEVVGRERFGINLFALGILDLDLERLVGELRRVVLVVLGAADPDFELDRLLRPVDGAIGDDEGLDLVVLLVGVRGPPDIVKAEVREPAVARRGDGEPLELIVLRVGERRGRPGRLSSVFSAKFSTWISNSCAAAGRLAVEYFTR